MQKKYAHSQYEKNKNNISKKHRKYYQEHIEDYKIWREKNKDHRKEQQREWYSKNKEYIAEYREANKEHIAKVSKEYRARNKATLKQKRIEYYANRPHYFRDYDRQRIAIDPLYKFKKQIRNSIYFSFYRRKYDKKGHVEEILGCNLDTFVKYLKGTYKQRYGVEWNEIDTVHIDHIIPLAEARDEDEIVKLCHYTNLQLLTPEDNMAKGKQLPSS